MAARTRRHVVLGVLALLTLVLAVAAVRTGADHDSPRAGGAVGGPVTPVLSPRRVPALLAAPVADRMLRAELDAVIAASPPATCLTVSVGGRVIYEHNPELALVPASTQKLVTATAAMAELGADTQLRTRVMAAAEPTDGVIDGDLFLVGGGDPLLATEPYVAHFANQPQIHTSLEALADAVADAGVERVQGRVVGDEGRYDSDRYPGTWPDRFAAQNQSGPLSALTVNDSFTAWPPVQEPGAEEETPALDPPRYAAEQLRDLLVDRGITVAGTAAAGRAPANASEVAGIDSPPMADIVREMLTESDNQTAELLVKELGRAKGAGPTTAAGVQVVTAAMRRLGLAAGGTGAADGSGLADSNATSCALLMDVLDRAGPTSALADGLAVAGETGTLAQRFDDSAAKGRLRGKTGTLLDVTALTGFADARQGPVLTFAYVANDARVTDALLELQEALGDDLVAYPQGPPITELGPRPIP
jgi:D-alanyl-D-alanine carboxypeptidase/D-alanyl-D-alanine-endopeptidase (penicillin-binding protein 4)